MVIVGSGSNTLIQAGGVTLLTLSNISSSSVTAADLQSTSTSAQTLTGDSSDNILVGGAGDDVLTSGAGSDELIGWGGDDTFNITDKSGSWTDTVVGGAGTDTLNISYGVNLESFNSISYDNSSTYQFIDSAGGTINFSSIEALNVNSVAWTFLTGNGNTRSDTSNMCAGYSRYDGVLSAPSENKIILFDWDSTSSTNITNLCMDTSTLGTSFSQSGGHYVATVYGSPLDDIIMVDNGWVATIDAGLGDDVVHAKDSDAADSIDMGAGDDFLIINTDSNDTLLDGGAGTDWFSFYTVNWSASATTYTLNSGVATNFENLLGTGQDDTLTGDGSANVIIGGEGDDTVNGGDGADTLWGDCTESACYSLISQNSSSYNATDSSGNDILNGGAGNDTIYGDGGDDTIDGGAGSDTYWGGAGIDLFKISASSGGASLADADVLMDFADGIDYVGLVGISFNELTVTQGSGDHSADTIIKYGVQYLLILKNTSDSEVSASDFVAL